jgi:predicted transcriptional regulator
MESVSAAHGGSTELLSLTAEVVAAYVRNHTVPQKEIGGLIQVVHAALSALGGNGGSREVSRPAVPIRQSVTPDHLVCLEDGKKFKSLKRHLRSQYDMTPEQYREKWGLKPDYPMVAPNYADARSKLAKKMGLGTRRHR